jgi:hypothetical protein
MASTTDFKVRLMIFNRTNKQGLTKVLIEVMQYEYAGTRKKENMLIH